MFRTLLLVSVFMGCCRADQPRESNAVDHELENIEKMGELRARWSRIHPVSFPPLTEEAKKYLESYSKKTAAEHTDYSPEMNENTGLIEGDIIPSDQDISEMEEKLRLEEEVPSRKVDGQRARRAAPVSNTKLWDKTKPVPFIIDPRYTKDEKTLIQTIIKRMTDNTCLTFEENGPGKPLEYFMEDNEGDCYSDLGDARENEREHAESQKIHLGKQCLTIRTIQHETMHALGFQHTHTRTDRDDYVQFDGKNIYEHNRINFDKLSMHQSETNYGIPYEYSSIMHYPSISGFEIDKSKPALLPKDMNYIKTLYGTYPAFNDWKMINVHYKCSEICDTQLECQNGGYQHPRVCTECVCPQFHRGTLCEEERDVVPLNLGAVKSINHGFALNVAALKSEYNYTTFERSPAKLIKAPEGTRIRVTIVNIRDSENFCPELCNEKAVEIVDGDLTRVGKRFCCHPLHDTSVNSTFVSTSNVVGIVFFTRPGLDFTANVTFSVEENPVSSQTENPTDKQLTTPSATTVEPSDPETEESNTSQTDLPETEDQTLESNTHYQNIQATTTEESAIPNV